MPTFLGRRPQVALAVARRWATISCAPTVCPPQQERQGAVVVAGLALLVVLLPTSTCVRHVNAPPPEKDAEARAFARYLTRAAQVIAEAHATPAPEPQMMRWALQGLYR